MKQLIKSLLKYKNLIPVFILGLVPVIWFWNKGNALINGVDTNFPLNPLIWFTRRFYVWNNVPNAGSDFSSSTAGLFFHLVQTVPYLLGFKLQIVEIFSLLFWFLLVVFSSFFLARVILPKRFLPQLLFIIFYSFNVYLFNTWENVKVTNLCLTVALPFVLGILILLDKEKLSRRSAVFLSILTGIVLSGTGINPSYFVCFLLLVFIYFLGNILFSAKSRVAKLKNLLLVLLATILVNAFWILPTFIFVIKGIPAGGSIGQIGFTNWVDSLSENTSLFNVMRLQGAWDWYAFDASMGLPLYIPYALNYFYSLPFIVFSLLIPALAILSLIFRKKSNNYLYICFALMLLVGVFLGTGTHPPTGTVYRYLLNQIPFFSLFRSPWYIFTPLVTLAYAGLIGLLFDNIYEFLEIKRRYLLKALLGFAGIILIAGNLLYCYPLVTGKIFRPGRPDGFYVSFPEYIFKAAQWLEEEGDGGRIINYPDDEVENFKWRYRGIDSILQLFTNREIIFASLNASDSPIAGLIKEFYLKLKKQELESAMKIAGKLNVSLIFEKNDQESLSPELSQKIRTNFESKKFGEWSFYKLPSEKAQAKIFSPSSLVYSYPYNQGPIAVTALEEDGQIINSDDNEVKKIPNIAKIAGNVIVADNLQMSSFQKFINSPSMLSDRLLSRNLSKAEFVFNVFEDGFYQPILESYRLVDFGIIPNGNLNALVDGQRTVFEFDTQDDSYIFYKQIMFKKGSHKLTFLLDSKNLIVNGDFEGEEMFRKSGYGEGRVDYEIKQGDRGNYLAITNFGKADASADFKVSDFNPYSPYYVEFRYKQIYGNNGLVVPTQNTATTLVKSQNERLPNYPEWCTFSFYYDPVKTESEMKIFLVSPFTSDPLGTKIFYDDLVVRKVFVNNLVFVKKGKNLLTVPEVSFKKSSPVLYRGTVRKAVGPHVILFSENYSSEWQITFFDERGRQIKIKPPHFTVNMYANGWFIDNVPESYGFKIYYKPQILYNIGIAISGLVLAAGFGFLLFRKHGNK